MVFGGVEFLVVGFLVVGLLVVGEGEKEVRRKVW